VMTLPPFHNPLDVAFAAVLSFEGRILRVWETRCSVSVSQISCLIYFRRENVQSLLSKTCRPLSGGGDFQREFITFMAHRNWEFEVPWEVGEEWTTTSEPGQK
jgi:hypothetical protein